jgi:GNAT superfamily N-acetyltransferase
MENDNYRKDGFLISTNKTLLDINYVHHYLSKESYWAQGVPYETVKRSIENSFCFGIYKDEKQIGFARVIADFATFAWLCDVFVDKNFRGFGLGKWMMETIHNHPKLQGFRVWMLGTKDAHGLYAQFGYGPHPEPHRIMRKPGKA